MGLNNKAWEMEKKKKSDKLILKKVYTYKYTQTHTVCFSVADSQRRRREDEVFVRLN